VIVFSSRGRIMRVAAAGGEPELVAAPDSLSATAYRFPDILPDGRTVLFTTVDAAGPNLAAVSLEDGQVRSLAQGGMSPRYVDGGILAFTQTDGTLFAAPFDAGHRRLSGAPQPIAESVRIGPAQVAKLGMARTGALAYYGGAASSRRLVVADRQGQVEPLPAPANRYRQPRFSPDGGRIAVAIDGSAGPGSGGDVWVYDLDARNLTRLTFDSVSQYPTWMPDGQHVAYTRGLQAVASLFSIATDGSGTPETLLVRPEPIYETEFSADGRTMVFRLSHPETSRDIWVTSADSPQAAVPLLRTPFNERQIALTPDGQWLAYVSNETGTDEVYLRRPQQGSPRWRVSPGGGLSPRWARAGRELFFWSGDSLLVVTVEAGAPPRLGKPRGVLAGSFQGSTSNTLYDVSADGNRIVLVQSEAQADAGGEEMHVLLHWAERFGKQQR